MVVSRRLKAMVYHLSDSVFELFLGMLCYDMNSLLTTKDTKCTKFNNYTFETFVSFVISLEKMYGGNTQAAKLRNSLARLRERVGVRVPVQHAHHPHLNPLPPKEGEEVKAHPAIFIFCG
jgi:hypothetical protein